ncbi:uncharacterized protein LOC130657876 [Hydractinia symbiolongicarpus]|uniref:uncharacterized protein LOC130657876 n=1 Tax=Hydractinia symbiolongicarpus TaxID=13093 RepID=UPI00254C0AD4|nr:uncharacterized protein LOC130657876 [Hydractinia symbiolongicarpus]
MINFHANVNNLDSFAEQENDDVSDEISNINNHDTDEIRSETENILVFGNTFSSITEPGISDDELHEKIRTLNKIQRQIFEVVNDWVRTYVKGLACNAHHKIKPIHIFLTGSAGRGKPLLITTISDMLNKALSYRARNLEKDKYLILAPTGVAAINIEGNTIHSAVGIPADRNFTKNISKLSDKKKCMLRNKPSELSVIVIDEISMVSNKLLLHIHQRLTEIFGCADDIPFAGISVIACGDFYQLPPIQARPVYAEYKDALLNLSHCWKHFKIAELTEVMRQRGDQHLIELLNNIRVGKLETRHEDLLKSKFISPNDPHYPKNAIHIFAENQSASEHNKKMLNSITSDEINIEAIDKIPENIPVQLVQNFNSRTQMETGGLARNLLLKLHAKVMLTSNIDVSDKLINGQIGTVHRLKTDSSGNVTRIYLKMEDIYTGLKAMRTDPYAIQENVVPINRVEKEIKFNKHNPSSPSMKRLQFPLMLSWACTVHKVQGKKFDKIVVCFDLLKQRAFHSGQIYVALSRVTSLDGLYLTGTFAKSTIKSDTRATEQYNYMREHSKLTQKETGVISENSIMVTLLNTRSYNKHKNDIRSDRVLMESDLLCLTETQIPLNSHFDSKLDYFTLIPNNNVDKFSRLLVGHNETIELFDIVKIPGAIFFRMTKRTFHENAINVLLLYRGNLKPQGFLFDFTITIYCPS